jgi:hypothetical protein
MTNIEPSPYLIQINLRTLKVRRIWYAKFTGNKHVVFTNTVEDLRNRIKEEDFVNLFGISGTSTNNLRPRFRFTYKPRNICTILLQSSSSSSFSSSSSSEQAGKSVYFYVEINQLNALNYTCILLYFSFTMDPTCFGKTMPSSGSDYIPFQATSASIW